MPYSISYRIVKSGEEIDICNLVALSFNEFIASDFPEQGIQEFFQYVNPRAFIKRQESGYFSMAAESDGKLAGMIELRGDNHISMLYVDKAFHRQGIAKQLVKKALEQVTLNNNTKTDITVNSSRYAVPFYESLGFVQFEEEKSVYGVIHTPMMLSGSKMKSLQNEYSN